MKRWKKLLLVILTLLVVMAVSIACILQTTPDFVAYMTRSAFSGGEDGVSYGQHPDHEIMEQQVTITKDIPYATDSMSCFDAYVPKDDTMSYPFVLWIHGGAFVGGDKQDISGFAQALSSQGYVVFTLNYSLAPEATYPTPLFQMVEFTSSLETLSEQFPIDPRRIFIGGDSAGAHIAFQFVTTQVNEAYREKMKVSQVLDPVSIKGVLSFCGLLDIAMYDETDSAFSNWLYEQSAWAYFDEKDWKQNISEYGADLNAYLTDAFPPVYLTDGDTDSFLAQAEKVRNKLIELNVPVDSLLWQTGGHPHEYQFQLDQAAGLENYDRVLHFLVQYQDQ